MNEELKLKLQSLATAYEQPIFLENDPAKFMHLYGFKQNQEIVAFICSWLAYGDRRAILNVCEKILDEIKDLTPLAYIVNGGWRKWVNNNKNLYRFYTRNDFATLCSKLKDIYDNHEDMENAVLEAYRYGGNPCDILTALMRNFNGVVKGIPQETTSACKRLNLFLRWMVRKNSPVDLGIWNSISSSELLIPLDTHVMRSAIELGLIPDKSKDNMKTVLNLTNALKEAFPDDPVRGDYALFGMGVDNNETNNEENEEE